MMVHSRQDAVGTWRRRDVLQGLIGLGAVALGRRFDPWMASAAEAATPRPGGTVKMAWTGSPRTLDPAVAVQAEEYMLTQNIYDNLTRIDQKLQPQPQLATRWNSNERGDVWTFLLRQG